ncbi:MAG TPA: dienelactone hydrolase family protein [Thermoanaerobaculia bacterium]
MIPLLLAALLAITSAPASGNEIATHGGGTVAIESRGATLHAILWRPTGTGSFPAVLFLHGSSPTFPPRRTALGPLFARHGYVFLFLFRRGAGLSASAGEESGAVMARELSRGGEEARNAVQLRLLETADFADAKAGLAYLRGLPGVDRRRVAVVGHSYGGSLSLLLAEAEPELGAVVDFAGAANSWAKNPELRERLVAAVDRISVPVLFLHAENDYSTAPGEALAAEMEKRRKPHSLKIYPPLGSTAVDGHDLVYSGVPRWESDVFGFLDAGLRR